MDLKATLLRLLFISLGAAQSVFVSEPIFSVGPVSFIDCNPATYYFCAYPYNDYCCTIGHQCISGYCIAGSETIYHSAPASSGYPAMSSTPVYVPPSSRSPVPSPASSPNSSPTSSPVSTPPLSPTPSSSSISSPPPQPPSQSSSGANPGTGASSVPQPLPPSSLAPPPGGGASSAPASYGMDLWLTAFLATGLTVGAAMVFL